MRAKKTALLLITALGMTSGCFRSADRKMATVMESPSLESFLKQAESSDLFCSFYNEEPWWTVFQDPRLNSLIRTALESNPSLQKAEAKVTAAQADAKAVRSNLFPKLNANANETWQYLSKYGLFRDFFPTVLGMPPIPHKFNEINLSLSFSYELDFWGKNRKMFGAALGLALAEEMERLQAKLIVSTSVAFSYFTWQAHFAELILRKKQLGYAEELLSLAEFRFRTGLDRVSPSLQTRDEKLSLTQKIEDLEKELKIDETFLKSLLGKGPDYPLELVFAWNPSEDQAYLPDTLGLDLLAKRPDIAAQILRVESARLNVGVAKTAFYPDVNLMALGGLSSLSFSKLFDWGSRAGNLRPAIHLPLFTGGKLTADLESKVALFNEAVYDYNERLLSAAEEVASEITSCLSLHSQIEEQKKRVALHVDLLNVAASRFEKGIDTYETVLISKKDLAERELYEVALKELQIFSAIRLIKATGGAILQKDGCK